MTEFIAHVQIMTADSKWEQEWIQSNKFKLKATFKKSLEDEGYQVLEIVNVNLIKTW